MKRLLLVFLTLCMVFPLSACSLFAAKEVVTTLPPEVHVHTYGEWQQLTAPTCAKDGVRKHTCACGTQELRMIPATGLHDYNADKVCTVCGLSQSEAHEVEIVTLGEYPQTLKSSKVNVSTTTDARGYYLGSDGEYYAKVTAHIWHRSEYNNNKNSYGFTDGSVYKFSDGTTLKHGTSYYFKVEPIKWRVLRDENGVRTLVCESILDNAQYSEVTTNTAGESVGSNNYKNSLIRTWLNETFLEKAFTPEEAEKVIGALVDNSAATNSPNGKYNCDNTTDKVFLPSYQDMVDVKAGFEADPTVSDDARTRVVTDYARACGTYFSNVEGRYGNGIFWLRSGATKATHVWCINSHGNANVARDVSGLADPTKGAYSGCYIGVVPAIRIAAE